MYAAPPAPVGLGGGEQGGNAGAAASGGMAAGCEAPPQAGNEDAAVAVWAARGAGDWRAGGRLAVRTGYRRESGRGDSRDDSGAR
eukprot:4482573-Alexandrium_andersonii.AAC.1